MRFSESGGPSPKELGIKDSTEVNSSNNDGNKCPHGLNRTECEGCKRKEREFETRRQFERIAEFDPRVDFHSALEFIVLADQNYKSYGDILDYIESEKSGSNNKKFKGNREVKKMFTDCLRRALKEWWKEQEMKPSHERGKWGSKIKGIGFSEHGDGISLNFYEDANYEDVTEEMGFIKKWEDRILREYDQENEARRKLEREKNKKGTT